MADKSIPDLSFITDVEGTEYFYGVQSSSDVKIIVNELTDYILNRYSFSHNTSNTNTIAGKIASLESITDTSDLADKTYPPGSLYWSRASTSPAELFGGVWVQVKDVFALAAGNSYPAGSSGGNSTHTLTLEEMPLHGHNTNTGGPSTNTSGKSSGSTGDTDTGHTHSIPKLTTTVTKAGSHTHTPGNRTLYGEMKQASTTDYRIENNTSSSASKYSWSSEGVHNHTITIEGKYLSNSTATHTHTLSSHTHTLSNHTHTIDSQGGGGAHNNMPPYVTYYCWERIE